MELEEDRKKFNKTVMSKDLLFDTTPTKVNSTKQKSSKTVLQCISSQDKEKRKLMSQKFKEKQEQNYLASQKCYGLKQDKLIKQIQERNDRVKRNLEYRISERLGLISRHNEREKEKAYNCSLKR